MALGIAILIGSVTMDRLEKQGINPYTIPGLLRASRHRHDDTGGCSRRAAGVPICYQLPPRLMRRSSALSKSAFCWCSGYVPHLA